MSKIQEMAKDLGEALGRTEEYQALKRAATGLDEDRELVELRNKLAGVEAEITALLRSGQEPEEGVREKYETLVNELQLRPAYQRLVVAQANFDKLLLRVNDTMSAGIQSGSTSRIILP